jgi:hypothetical protein
MTKIPWPTPSDDCYCALVSPSFASITDSLNSSTNADATEYKHRCAAKIVSPHTIGIKRGGRNDVIAWVYAIGPLSGGLTKIGFSRNPTQRLATIQSMSPVHMTLIWKTRGGRALEALLHTAFDDKRVRGEWFDLGPTPAFTIEQTIRLCLPQWTLRAQSLRQLYRP